MRRFRLCAHSKYKCLVFLGFLAFLVVTFMQYSGSSHVIASEAKPSTSYTNVLYERHIHLSSNRNISHERHVRLSNNRNISHLRDFLFHRIRKRTNQRCGKKISSDINSSKVSIEKTLHCTNFMQLDENIGRIGNQLFRIATLIGTAWKYNLTPLIRPTNKLGNLFHLPTTTGIQPTNLSYYGETLCCSYERRIENLSPAHNWTIMGYFQSWKYFADSEDMIRSVFTLKEHLSKKTKEYVEGVTRNVSTAVGVHVRRGDFTKPYVMKSGYTLAPLNYIDRAMAYFKNKYQQVDFFIISDDKTWCANTLNGSNVTISPFGSAEFDFALLMSCDHVIMTSGTFGWWGGWLTGGEVVYWKGFPGNGTFLGIQTNHDDFYPSSWIGLL